MTQQYDIPDYLLQSRWKEERQAHEAQTMRTITGLAIVFLIAFLVFDNIILPDILNSL